MAEEATASSDDGGVISSWKEAQRQYREKVSQSDPIHWRQGNDAESVSLVGGLDISFVVGDEVNACAGYVVVDLTKDDFQVVYKDLQMVEMTAPYIPGFLAFRESSFLVSLVEKQRRHRPDLTPSVLMVDGNGVLHPRKCGVACHIGIDTGIPTLGVAKNLHQIEEFGEEFTRQSVKERYAMLTEPGQHIQLSTLEGEILGAALRTNRESKNPVFVSVGTGISLDTGIKVVSRASRSRIPEPTRQADILTREYLRIHHPTERQRQQFKKKK